MTKPILSIGIIFRDDIRSIERCLTALESLRAAVPCQLVMADTGSSDGSRAVAERFADILFDFPWINDFAAARNAVIDRCTGQWFLSLDTDEYLDKDISELVSFLTHKKKQVRNYCGVVIRSYDTYEMDHDYSDFIGIRMARMSIGARYEGAIHEHWITNGTMSMTPLKRTLLHHDGYVGMNGKAGEAKRERNLTLIRQELEREPEKLILWLQLIESGPLEKDFPENLRHTVEMVQRGVRAADRLGPPVMRYAVMYGYIRDFPETEEWLRWTEEHFPNSLYTRLDVAYYAALFYRKKKEFRQCIAYGEKYLAARGDYETGKIDSTAQMYSVLKTETQYWERNIKIILANAHCEEKEYERAFSLMRTLDGFTGFDEKQIADFLAVLKDIHRYSMVDTASVITDFWSGLSLPEPSQARADVRIKTFLQASEPLFRSNYIRSDAESADVIRPAFTLFTPLDGVCELGTAAAIEEQADPVELTRKLTEVNLKRIPIHTLTHALDCGVVFPLTENPMYVEEMDSLALRLAKEDIAHMAVLIRKAAEREDVQALAWTRGLTMAAIRLFRWDDEAVDAEQAMELARQFATVEKMILPVCYTVQSLSEEGLFLLPPMHRFGWYCARAFDALDAENWAECVRALRAALESCKEMKSMVEFLVERIKEMEQATRIANAPLELVELAQRVKLMLSRFSPDDPAVAELKQSSVYQQIAWMIEDSVSLGERL